MNIDKIAEAVKQGVAQAGGAPFVFPAIAVCDGIAMGHEGMRFSLATRELIVDSTVAMATAHAFDGWYLYRIAIKVFQGCLWRLQGSKRLCLAKETGMQIVELVKKG